MNIPTAGSKPNDGYLFGPRQAWFAFAMTIGLMLFDYIDRQVIVSLFPYMKADWGLSDKQLGALVSVLSIVLAACALPVSLVADRVSRVKSIVTMATRVEHRLDLVHVHAQLQLAAWRRAPWSASERPVTVRWAPH